MLKYESRRVLEKIVRKYKTKRPAKKVFRSTAKRAHKSPALTGKNTAMAVKLPFVQAPPTQVIIALEEPKTRPVSPMMMWSAFPFALMRMVLGTRHSAVGR